MFALLQRMFSLHPTELYNHNMDLGRSEMLGSHQPINLDQYPSRLPRPTSQDERVPGYHVVPSTGNTTRNGFGWRLRPVSELRASARIYRSLLIKCQS